MWPETLESPTTTDPIHDCCAPLRVVSVRVTNGRLPQPPLQFLAKLATNLAKPRGVCVLRRRDVSALLAATPATKIPGCGAGSAAAKQFAAWGAKTVLDLRRIDAPEMRQHLGEQQGKKVIHSNVFTSDDEVLRRARSGIRARSLRCLFDKAPPTSLRREVWSVLNIVSLRCVHPSGTIHVYAAKYYLYRGGLRRSTICASHG